MMSMGPMNKWVVTAAVMLGTIMEVLDGTAVSVSLPHMQGSLSASLDEVTWVLTSYLVSNAVILPITGWLASVFGRRRFFLFCLFLFTASSIACGAAPSLEALILFRVLQGLGGGAMVPTAQAILMETFPPEEQGMAMAAFGMGVVTAPIIGPTLGGWITDNYGWRWIFYINLPVGVVAVAMTALFVFDPPYIRRRLARIDYPGLALIVLGIGALQVVLDKGEREDWFASDWLTSLAIVSATALAAFIVWALQAPEPVVDLSALKVGPFAAGVFIITLVGFGLYGSSVLLPVFLQNLMGYTAMQAGLVIAPGAVASMLAMPLVGRLINRVDVRFIVAAGMVFNAVGLFHMSRFTLDLSFWQFVWPRVIQGVGLGCIFVPLTTAALGAIPKERMGNASGIFNLMRNIGGSFGIAVSTTLLSRRGQLHQTHLVSHVNPFDAITEERIAAVAQAFAAGGSDPLTARQQALGEIYGQVSQQVSYMAYMDNFWLMAILFVLLLLTLPFLGPGRARGAQAAATEKGAAGG
jgi:DHA2 family multidrug resistance protein